MPPLQTLTILSAVVILLGSSASAELMIRDDFESAGGGLGWSSSWGPEVVFLSTNPGDTASPQHVQSTAVAAFRYFTPEAISAVDASSELWIGFRAHMDHPIETAQFGGVSAYAGGGEVFFMGAPWLATDWSVETVGGPAGPASGTTADANWVSLLYHLDFGASRIDLYVNGALGVSYFTMPSRAWDAVRITASGGSSANPLFVDRLRVATTREEADPDRAAPTLAGSEVVGSGATALENAGGTLRLLEPELDFVGRAVFVPEPGFLWQLGSGLGLLGMLTRRRGRTPRS